MAKKKNDPPSAYYLGGRPIDNKTTRRMKHEIIEAFFACGGKNRMIRDCKDNPDRFWELVKIAVKFVPREIDLKQDTTINLMMSLPRPEGEQKALEHNEEVKLVDAMINGESMKEAVDETIEEEEDDENCGLNKIIEADNGDYE